MIKRQGHLRLSILVVASLCACVCNETSCIKQPRRVSLASQTPAAPVKPEETTPVPRININTASAAELEKLPGIGKALAARIVAHRQQYGRFRRAEHLLMVHGISDRRFREMRGMISVE